MTKVLSVTLAATMFVAPEALLGEVGPDFWIGEQLCELFPDYAACD